MMDVSEVSAQAAVRDASAVKTYFLEREQELRLECEPSQSATVKVTVVFAVARGFFPNLSARQLVAGTAEYFGTELALHRQYDFSGERCLHSSGQRCGAPLCWV